jgi:hypothetical protein
MRSVAWMAVQARRENVVSCVLLMGVPSWWHWGMVNRKGSQCARTAYKGLHAAGSAVSFLAFSSGRCRLGWWDVRRPRLLAP